MKKEMTLSSASTSDASGQEDQGSSLSSRSMHSSSSASSSDNMSSLLHFKGLRKIIRFKACEGNIIKENEQIDMF